MKETRQKEIKDKVFTKEDVRSIWRGVYEHYKSSKKQSGRASVELTINCLDGTRYESEDSNLLDEREIIDLKKSESVSIDYYDYQSSQRISITLRHGEYGNNLLVAGENKNWVAGTFDQFQNLLNAVKPQEHWFIKYKPFFLNLGAVVIGYSLFKFWAWLDNLGTTQEITREVVITPLIEYGLIIGFSWLFGVLPTSLLSDWVSRLWPSVEFDFGPEHQKEEKIRRTRLGLFFTLLGVPLLFWFLTSDWFIKLVEKML